MKAKQGEPKALLAIFIFIYDTTLNCSFSYETTSFVRAVEEIWMFVICLHLVRPPPPPIPYLALCWSEKRASWFWAFSRHPQLHGSSCLLHGIFLQQKGNRCALMSTADYSRNIARKMRPRSSDGLSVKTTLVSVLPHELGGFFFGGAGANRRVGSFLFSTADRDKIRLVHTHFWSTLPLPFSPQT